MQTWGILGKLGIGKKRLEFTGEQVEEARGEMQQALEAEKKQKELEKERQFIKRISDTLYRIGGMGDPGLRGSYARHLSDQEIIAHQVPAPPEDLYELKPALYRVSIDVLDR